MTGERFLYVMVLFAAVVGVHTTTAGEPAAGRAVKPQSESISFGNVIGVVTELTPNAITVRERGWDPVQFVFTDEFTAGKALDGISWDLTAKPPVCIVCPPLPPCYRYVPRDVRVGDIVLVSLRKIGDIHRCRAITIYRRPGGRVPTAPGEEDLRSEVNGSWRGWAAVMNAEQDWDERKVPLPDWYRGAYQDPSFMQSAVYKALQMK